MSRVTQAPLHASKHVGAQAVVRAARRSDLDSLIAMLGRVDPGLLTMPDSPDAMAERVEKSLRAFAGGEGPEGACFFLVLEEDGRLLGTASLFTALGAVRPFYSYRISRVSKVSPDHGVKVEVDLLHLVNDYHGACELGTLFLLPEARGGGRGRLLSYARLMLIAAAPDRFGTRAMAEIRGWTDAEGRSPFWEAVGQRFFRMDYGHADRLSAREHRFIADLMPHYPIYADLLPEAARDVIGRCHPNAEPAAALLRAQGFHYNNVVDIFDAGPCLEAFIDRIDMVREAKRRPAGEAGFSPRGLVATSDIRDSFAVTSLARPDALAAIGVASDSEALIYRPEGA